MRVYADVLFALNGGADYALLVAAGRLIGLRARPRRLALGAVLGGLYGIGALLVPVPLLFSLPATALVAALMAAAAYAPRPPRVFLRLLLCLYGSAALAAGLARLLAPAGAVPWWVLVAGLGGAAIAAGVLGDRWRPGSALQCLCDLEIEISGRRTTCRALLDTGNGLSDPCGDGPAVVIDAPLLRGLLPPRLLAALQAGPEAVAAGVVEASAAAEPGMAEPWDPWGRRIRLLPYRTVNRAAGLLCAVRPDAVWLGSGVRRRSVRAVVAVSATPLDPDGVFGALVPATLAGPQAEPARGRMWK